jgi:hypothetical protein
MFTEYVSEIYFNATTVSMSRLSSGILYRYSNERNIYASLLPANVRRSNEKCKKGLCVHNEGNKKVLRRASWEGGERGRGVQQKKDQSKGKGSKEEKQKKKEERKFTEKRIQKV